MGLIIRDNDALRTNPPAGDEYLSEGGSDWLWAVFAIFTFIFVSATPGYGSHGKPDPICSWYSLS